MLRSMTSSLMFCLLIAQPVTVGLKAVGKILNTLIECHVLLKL